MYYPERPQNRKTVSGVLLFAIGLFLEHCSSLPADQTLTIPPVFQKE